MTYAVDNHPSNSPFFPVISPFFPVTLPFFRCFPQFSHVYEAGDITYSPKKFSREKNRKGGRDGYETIRESGCTGA